MLLALDEFANTAPVPRLEEVAATASGLGIQLITVLQDLFQMKDPPGSSSASAVNNHRAKIAVGGISDLDTTEYFSRLAGTAEFVHRTTSSGRGRDGDSTTEGKTFRELARNTYCANWRSGPPCWPIETDPRPASRSNPGSTPIAS